MDSLLTKSEFLRRLRLAAGRYISRFGIEALTASSGDIYKVAAEVAKKECKLPATANLSDPITAAVVEIGLPGIDPMKVMILAEAAWEHIQSDKQAYQTLKELNQ